MSIETVVQQQIEFYNKQDLEGFASTYADDITVFSFPDNTITLNGKQALIERYKETFKKKMFAEIRNRSIVGNKVIDWEIATNGITGESTSLMAIYEVNEHLISKVWFIRE
ncbi:nuclear transport factor 2 family protein [Neobacillus pocheonensis]|uniref:nuclear transport factor 2 family protein n=1 Tax=Neobacillus pocheonensis TaxID=363869 RepID=UPI003D287E95